MLLVLLTLMFIITPIHSTQSSWDINTHLRVDHIRCTIEQRDALSEEEFGLFYHEQRPVVFNRMEENIAFREKCGKQFLLDNYQNAMIKLSTANSFSYEKKMVTLRQYVEEMMEPQSLDVDGDKTFYLFGDNTADMDPLINEYDPPHFTNYTVTPSLSWGLAGDGSGVPFHVHGAVFAEVISGRKLWFLYPPSQKLYFFPNKTTLHWLTTEYPQLTENAKPLECILSPGQVLYIPSAWYHATLNLGQSVFISAFV